MVIGRFRNSLLQLFEQPPKKKLYAVFRFFESEFEKRLQFVQEIEQNLFKYTYK